MCATKNRHSLLTVSLIFNSPPEVPLAFTFFSLIKCVHCERQYAVYCVLCTVSHHQHLFSQYLSLVWFGTSRKCFFVCTRAVPTHRYSTLHCVCVHVSAYALVARNRCAPCVRWNAVYLIDWWFVMCASSFPLQVKMWTNVWLSGERERESVILVRFKFILLFSLSLLIDYLITTLLPHDVPAHHDHLYLACAHWSSRSHQNKRNTSSANTWSLSSFCSFNFLSPSLSLLLMKARALPLLLTVCAVPVTLPAVPVHLYSYRCAHPLEIRKTCEMYYPLVVASLSLSRTRTAHCARELINEHNNEI